MAAMKVESGGEDKNSNTLYSSEEAEAYRLEFRDANDDSWYTVRAVLDGETLIIKYLGFLESCDQRFHAADFGTSEDLSRFRLRFRPASVQLQDHQCSQVKHRTTVCASHKFDKDDVRFHDALIDDVKRKQHAVVNGEEECNCEFMLYWLHGPKTGTLTTTTIEDICIIQPSAEVDPTVGSFLNRIMEKVPKKLSESGSSSGGASSASESPFFYEKICHSIEKTKSPGQLESNALTFEGKKKICCIKEEQDIDVGGDGNSTQHVILIHNMEKELSSTAVVEFIYHHSKIMTRSLVLPSLSSESCTRGIVVVYSMDDLKMLHKFLDNPNHIVISSGGRPWVTTGKLSSCTLLRIPSENMAHYSKGTFIGYPKELKISVVGTHEYDKAKKLKQLYMDFAEHQERMHMSLASEMQKMMSKTAVFEEPESAAQLKSNVLTTEGKKRICTIKEEQDIDVGGDGNCTQHLILIHNLEKDLSSRTVVEFIYHHSTITTEAFVFPSLSSESYTRGIVVVHSKENLKKLHKFLDSPDHTVISSGGRPLVMTDKLSSCGLLRIPTENIPHHPKGTVVGRVRELTLAAVGTQEYNQAKKLKQVFMEFVEHQERLHKSLAWETGQILQGRSLPSTASDLPASFFGIHLPATASDFAG